MKLFGSSDQVAARMAVLQKEAQPALSMRPSGPLLSDFVKSDGGSNPGEHLQPIIIDGNRSAISDKIGKSALSSSPDENLRV